MLPARDNPFRSERIEALRYRLDAAGWSALLARFAALGRRGALVGGHGTGKTTLREELERRLAAEGFRIRNLRLHADRPGPDAWPGDLGPGDLLVVDGLEQLDAWRWWRLRRAARRAGGILATSHHPGRLPTLHEHRTTPELLGELVAELAGAQAAARLAPRCAALHAGHGGDLRACLRALYDEAGQG